MTTGNEDDHQILVPPRRNCQEQNFLLEDKANIVEKIKRNLLPSIQEQQEMSSSYESRASVGISQLSIPLAWNSDQHFKSKGEIRSYSMFAVLQSRTKVIDSKLITNVDRSMTDVVFPESFVFEGETDDFLIEICLFAARTDQGIAEQGKGIKSMLSRSFGKKFGNNVKTQLNNPESLRSNSVLSGSYFNMLARTYLVLTDASDVCKIYDLTTSAFADLSGPPLYGHLMCRMVVQPESVYRPIAQGILTVSPSVGSKPLMHVRSRLQAGNLVCYVNNDVHKCPTAEEILLRLPITADSTIDEMSSTSFCITTENTDDCEGSTVSITVNELKSMQFWTEAFSKQINECRIWGEYAYRRMKLIAERNVDPVKETLSKAAGNRLYDKISINGTVRDLDFSLYNSIPYNNPTNVNRTAPTSRSKQRATVMDIFPMPEATLNNRISTNITIGKRDLSPISYTPVSNKVRNELFSTENFQNDNYNYDYVKNGKKSWSRSLGNFIGKKMATNVLQTTRL